MPTTLADLPAELIFRIHLLSLNPFLPRTNRYIHSVLHHPSPYYAANYLLNLYSAYGPDEIFNRSLRHPICTVDTAESMKKIWDRRRGYIAPSTISSPSKRRNSAGPNIGMQSDSNVPAGSPSSSSLQLPEPTLPALSCTELPRRLFRNPSNVSEPVHPLIQYLFSTYTPSPNSHKGYPLFRAILTSNCDLVSYLLSQGADPGIRDCFALEIAISRKDLRMVRILVEPDPPDTSTKALSPNKEAVKKGKKFKLGDRVKIGTNMVEKAIQTGSKDIINYFVYEKKVMPPLQSIMSLGKPDRNQTPKTQQRKKQPRTSSFTSKA
ncbi:uncharacterized protein IL334_004997 [Kwoniella shivajii]|uniref:Ankyrin repeat protein n=1 Tax=Kwoniella shivajii TaxID=564305 RepID=A0ABZ1D5V6_9TREE|nr:hypothetical protein IL334_004997 [Kwoniella shivajii]